MRQWADAEDGEKGCGRMAAFMVVCRFKEGTAMDEVFAVVAEEQAQV